MHDHHKLKLKIDIQTYWHAGTGRGRSFEIDSVVHRDRDNLPALPGRSVKGLVRDAVTAAVALGWIQTTHAASCQSEIVNDLFGPLGVDGALTHPGWLHFSDAVLADDVRIALRGNLELQAAMYANLYTTAIDHGNGSALVKSLRGIEVAVPMTLYAAVNVDTSSNHKSKQSNSTNADIVIGWVNTSLPLLRNFGSHRNRGLGRAMFSLIGGKQ